MENYKEKGQMGNIGAIVGLIVGVAVAVLVLIFVGSLGGQTFQLVESNLDQIANNAVTVDTFAANATKAQSLDHGFIQSGTLAIFNSTGTKAAWALSNFTIDYDAGTVLVKTTSLINNHNGTLAANYTWGAVEVRESSKEAILGGFDALEKTSGYLPIVVLAVVIALVLGLVLGFGGMTSKGGGGSAL